MPKYKRIDVDQSIRQALDEKVNLAPPPLLSSTEAWSKMQKAKKKPNHYYQKALMIAIPILFLLAIVWSPQNGSAFGRLIDVFHSVQGSAVQLFVKVGGEVEAEGTPIPDEIYIVEGSELIAEKMNLTEAQEITTFQILIPKSLPAEFQLEQVTVMRAQNEESNEIYLNYVGDDRGFMIGEMEFGEDFGLGLIMDQDDTNVEEIMIHGQKASLILFKNGISRLVWVTQSHYFSIEGELTKEEIIKIAESM